MKFIGTKTLETERLILRKVRLEDAKEAYDNWCSSDNVARYVLWTKHKDVEETKSLFSAWEKMYEDPSTYRWIVQIKDTNELIGTIDVCSKKFFCFSTCEIGYCYGEKFWNKGYATEVLKRVIKFLFEEVEAETICADHASLNPASGIVMKKSGMKCDGIQRSLIIDKDGIRNDIVNYSITKEDYFKEEA